MASIKHTPSGAFQLCVKNKLLPKTLWATFDTRDAAEQYGMQLERLLRQGIVPTALLEQAPPKPQAWTVGRCIAEYLRHNAVPESDVKLLDTVCTTLALLGTSTLNYDWAEAWVRSMKRVDHLAPSTIRHRHGALARCFDWMTRKHPDIMAQNPLRLLKRGFSTYTPEDAALLAQEGKEPRFDIERDRRMAKAEETSIFGVLADRAEDRVFFGLALETAMRMRECYTLYVDQVNLQKRTIHLDRSKNGDTRQVPLSSVARELLDTFMREYQADIAARDGRLFSFWNGDLAVRTLDSTTAEVSRRFRITFTAAGVNGLTFHDLRHEATCRLYERTSLSDVLIAKITGHRDPRMLRRYASLRGSDLAAHLW
jgi:integrase